MATGIIGVLAGAGTITYTAVNPAKICVAYNGSNGCSINGATVLPAATGVLNKAEFWLGAGQTLTVSVSASPSNPGSTLVSCLEG